MQDEATELPQGGFHTVAAMMGPCHDTVTLGISPTTIVPEVSDFSKSHNMLVFQAHFLPNPALQMRLLHCNRMNCATIANYLRRELRYMDAGERGSSAS